MTFLCNRNIKLRANPLIVLGKKCSFQVETFIMVFKESDQKQLDSRIRKWTVSLITFKLNFQHTFYDKKSMEQKILLELYVFKCYINDKKK